MRFLWIIISKITLSETLAKHILFTSDRYIKMNVQDYIILLQYELNIHLFYQELQIKTNRSKTYIPTFHIAIEPDNIRKDHLLSLENI